MRLPNRSPNDVYESKASGLGSNPHPDGAGENGDTRVRHAERDWRSAARKAPRNGVNKRCAMSPHDHVASCVCLGRLTRCMLHNSVVGCCAYSSSVKIQPTKCLAIRIEIAVRRQCNQNRNPGVINPPEGSR